MDINKIPNGLKNFIGKVVLERGNEREIKYVMKNLIPEFQARIRDTKREEENYDWESDEEDCEWIETLEKYIEIIKKII